jgi:hypothetical protein
MSDTNKTILIPPFSDILAARRKLRDDLAEKERKAREARDRRLKVAVEGHLESIITSELQGKPNTVVIASQDEADLVLRNLQNAGWDVKLVPSKETGRPGETWQTWSIVAKED